MRASDTGSLDAAQAELADAGLKAMIPFGRPFLDHVLHSLAEAGVTRVALVLGPEHDAVRKYYRAIPARRLAIDFVIQPEPRGTADAVLAAEPWVGADPFLVLNADNLYPVDVLAHLVACSGPALPGFRRRSLGLPDARLGAFALVEADAAGCLARVVEKPGTAAVDAAGPDAMISMNLWRFDECIFDACRAVPLSPRGEFELPQAVALSISRGVCFTLFAADGPVLDLSRRSDIGRVAPQLEGSRVDL